MGRNQVVYSHASKYSMLFPGHVKHAARNRPHDRRMHWGQRLKQEREAQGLSQKEVGAFAGLTKGAVSQWENGGSIRPENLFAIAERLKVSPKWLAVGRGSRHVDDSSLTAEESALITAFRALPKAFRVMLQADAAKYLAAIPKLDRENDDNGETTVIPH